jgi:hypothetical protein
MRTAMKRCRLSIEGLGLQQFKKDLMNTAMMIQRKVMINLYLIHFLVLHRCNMEMKNTNQHDLNVMLIIITLCFATKILFTPLLIFYHYSPTLT